MIVRKNWIKDILWCRWWTDVKWNPVLSPELLIEGPYGVFKYLKNNATKDWTAGFSAKLPIGKLVEVTADEVNHAFQCLAEKCT